MKKITIKFRGITVKYKEVVYGYLFHCGDKAFIMSLVFYIVGEWEMQTDEVYPDSIAQLVGYDAEGKEVYEGDTVFDADNNAVIAALYPNAHYKNYTLKRKW